MLIRGPAEFDPVRPLMKSRQLQSMEHMRRCVCKLLDGLTLKIPAGRQVAIVGDSAARDGPHRVDADDRPPLKMIQHRLIVESGESLVCAFTAAHSRLLANPVDPLIPTRRSVAAPLGARVGPEFREHIVSPSEQALEEGDLSGWCVWRGEGQWLCPGWAGLLRQLRLEQDEPFSRFDPLALEFRQMAPLSLDRQADGVWVVASHRSA